MAIAPIDLQTLFTQLDKVGKAQSVQREGHAIHQAIAGVEIQQKTEQVNHIKETQDSGDGADKIKDRPDLEHEGQTGGKKKGGKKQDKNDDGQDAESENVFLRDPNLGKKIDISL